MERNKAILIFLVLVIGSAAAYQIRRNPIADWPAVRSLAQSDDQRYQDLSRHRPLIIHFWASWCGPCREEFPLLVKAYEQVSRVADLRIVSLDEDREQAVAFLRQVGGESLLPLAGWDPDQQLAKRLGTAKMPETYVFSADRKSQRKIAGVINWLDPVNLEFVGQF